jgi:hypothetical protein
VKSVVENGMPVEVLRPSNGESSLRSGDELSW